MFVLLNLRCSAKQNQLQCCDTSSITTDYMRTMWYGLKIVVVMTFTALQNMLSHADVFTVLKKAIVNHGTLKIYRGVGVPSTFLAGMQCFY